MDVLKGYPSPITPEAAGQFIKGRRSVVRYRPECPDTDIIKAAIDAARWAPNHYLTNPWHFYILGDKAREAVIQLNTQVTAEKRGAESAAAKEKQRRQIPGWLAVTCQQDEKPRVAEENYAATACAIHNVMLYLYSAGIGTKWTTGAATKDPRFFEALGIRPQPGEYCAGLIWYGYPAREASTKRVPVEDILTILS